MLGSLYGCESLCVCVCARARAHVCVCLSVCVCVRARVRARLHTCVTFLLVFTTSKKTTLGKCRTSCNKLTRLTSQGNGVVGCIGGETVLVGHRPSAVALLPVLAQFLFKHAHSPAAPHVERETDRQTQREAGVHSHAHM